MKFNVLSLPKSIKYLLLTELAERFSYFGIMSILVTHMINNLQSGFVYAVSIVHVFIALSYFAPLIGAWLSDRYFNKFKIIFSSSCLYLLGHICLSKADSPILFHVGLLIVAIMSGVAKPCIPAIISDQCGDNVAVSSRAISFYYWAINIGSTISSILTPWLFFYYGSRVAFLLPAVAMLLALIFFYLGKSEYIILLPPRIINRYLYRGIAKGVVNYFKKREFFENNACSDQLIEDIVGFIKIFKIFFIILPFFIIYQQMYSSWVVQGSAMDGIIFGFRVVPAQLQAINPIGVIIFLPLIRKFITPFLIKKNIVQNVTDLIFVGIILSAVACLSIVVIEVLLSFGNNISLLWQAVSYILITLAEIFIYGYALDIAFSHSCVQLRVLAGSMFYITVFCGNVLAALLPYVNKEVGMIFFMGCFVLSMLNIIAFYLTKKNLKM